MGAIGKILISPIAAAVGLFNKPKPQLPAPTIKQNTGQERNMTSDNLARRTGQRANRRTPYGGAEASAPKTSVLGRSG